MNHFYIAKKSCFISGILNIIGSISLILLIWIISYYHFSVLLGGTNKYNDLLTASSGSSNSVNTPLFASEYIKSYGYAKFFGAKLTGGLTAWPFVCTFFVTTVLCFSIKTVLCIFSAISSFKSKSIIYLHASLVDLFFPLIGGIAALVICRDTKKIIEYKATLPLQWMRFKLKNIFYQIFSDVNMKNL